MSATATRVALASRLSTITGVKGYEFRPSVLKAGAAWPLLDVAERGPGNAFAYTWRVILFLGGDEKVAQQVLDDRLPEIVDALEPDAYVESARPINFQIERGEVYGLEIRVRSE